MARPSPSSTSSSCSRRPPCRTATPRRHPRRQARSGLAGLTRKLQELKYSIELEKQLTKDQILQGYINIVYYGDQAYGVEAASQHYFGHPASKLTLVEAATLAGLAQNPGTTDPVHFPTKAQARRNVVLDRMLQLGIITQKDHDAAVRTPIAKTLKVTQPASSCASAGQFAYFCQYILAYLLTSPDMAVLGKTRKEREEKIYNGGLTIKTTLNPGLAQAMKQQIESRVPEGNDQRGINIGSAAVTMDPNTGAVEGMRAEHDVRVRRQGPAVEHHPGQLRRRPEVRRLGRLPVRLDRQDVRRSSPPSSRASRPTARSTRGRPGRATRRSTRPRTSPAVTTSAASPRRRTASGR